jgi:PHD/YefM family antitoxin component YafN of YafNO toxin-antitoxin module
VLLLNYGDKSDMIRVTEAELKQGFDTVADHARREPVAIASPDGSAEFIVLSAAEYARLKRRDRRVGLAEELPEEWVEAVRNAEVPEEFADLDAVLK